MGNATLRVERVERGARTRVSRQQAVTPKRVRRSDGSRCVQFDDHIDPVMQEICRRRAVVLLRPQPVAIVAGGECAAQRYRAVLFVVGAGRASVRGWVPVAVEAVRRILVVGVEAVRRPREAGRVAGAVVRRALRIPGEPGRRFTGEPRRGRVAAVVGVAVRVRAAVATRRAGDGYRHRCAVARRIVDHRAGARTAELAQCRRGGLAVLVQQLTEP